MMVLSGEAVAEADAARARAAQLPRAAQLAAALAAAGADLYATPATLGEAPLALSSTGSSAMQIPWSFTGMPSVAVPAGSRAWVGGAIPRTCAGHSGRRILGDFSYTASVF